MCVVSSSFLGPLYAWTAAVSDRCANLALPKAVWLVMKYLLEMLESGRNLQCWIEAACVS